MDRVAEGLRSAHRNRRDDGRRVCAITPPAPTPLHPFGFGLSYTQFECRKLKLSAPKIAPDGQISVTAVVRNTGRRSGVEVAQLYIQDVIGSITRPVKELRGFHRVALEPGWESLVRFTLGPGELGFFKMRNEFVVEPGLFRVWVGPDSTRGLEAAFEVVG
ncbi:MAG TPA: fibronectin type III-like domain-contianing protein [Opitutaceae bacterium]|nr:fibronectin type III-like domain-contianing protein [Opitutaceae bacterium]